MDGELEGVCFSLVDFSFALEDLWVLVRSEWVGSWKGVYSYFFCLGKSSGAGETRVGGESGGRLFSICTLD